MTFPRPSLDKLIEQGVADIDGHLPESDPRLPVSNLNVMAFVVGGVADGLHGHIDWLVDQVVWVSSRNEYLDRWASLVGKYRKQAVAAIGTATFPAGAGAALPEGTRMQRGDGVEYEATADGVAAGDSVTVPVAAVEAGVAGNAAAGVKLQLVTTVSGVTSVGVVATGGISAGADGELNDGLRDRFLGYWRDAAERDGPYAALARDVPGVTRAWEYSHEMGLGTVTVRFAMDGKPDTAIPTGIEVAEVDAWLQAKRPPGMPGLYVVAPIADPVDITLAISPDTPATRAAVEAEIADFIRREAEPGDPTIVSRLAEAISSASGEYKHRLVSPAADVNHAYTAMAVPGTVTWVVY